MDSDSSDNTDSYTDTNRSLRKFLKNQDASEPDPKRKFNKMPKMQPEEDSSDSYNSFSHKKHASNKKDAVKNKKHHSTQFESSDNDENNFTTSQINPDYKMLEEQYANLTSLSSEEGEIQKVFKHRRPPPSSVAYQLRSSSDDEDDKPKPKPKMQNNPNRRFAESVAPTKKTRFKFEEESAYNNIKFDDSVSQRNARPVARTFAPSVSSFKSSKSAKKRKWTPSVASESPLDREIEQLKETESRITAAEQERLQKDLEFYTGEANSTYSESQRKQRNQNQNKQEEDIDVQTKVEKYYARMLKKKFPHLVEKKNELHKKHEQRHHLNFNNNIILWSREMIAEDNKRIQKEINQINKQLKKIQNENDFLKEQIDNFGQDFVEYEYDSNY